MGQGSCLGPLVSQVGLSGNACYFVLNLDCVLESGCIGSVMGWRSDRLSGLSCQNTPEESRPWAPTDRPSLLLPLLVLGCSAGWVCSVVGEGASGQA